MSVGTIDASDLLGLPSCLDMLVKLPGGELTLPEPYGSNPAVREAFRLAVSAEDLIVGDWRQTRPFLDFQSSGFATRSISS